MGANGIAINKDQVGCNWRREGGRRKGNGMVVERVREGGIELT